MVQDPKTLNNIKISNSLFRVPYKHIPNRTREYEIRGLETLGSIRSTAGLKAP